MQAVLHLLFVYLASDRVPAAAETPSRPGACFRLLLKRLFGTWKGEVLSTMKQSLRFYQCSMFLLGLGVSLLLLPRSASAAPELIMPPSTATITSQGGVITFTFSEPMDPTGIDIAWEGAAIDPAKFSCEWQDEMFGFPVPPIRLDCTYEGGLPPDVEISYTLNPGGSGVIKSQSGQALPETSGSFVTPGTSQSSSSCLGITPEEGKASIMIMKRIHYRQSGSSDPELDTEEKAAFFASVQNATDASKEVTAATLVKPNNDSTSLTELSVSGGGGGSLVPDVPSQFFLTTSEPPDITYPTFDTEAALNSAFPDGLYSMNVELKSGGSGSAELPLEAPDPFSAPKITNLQGLQDFDGSQPVTIEWNAFSAAGQHDAISIVIFDADGNVVFEAPNRCADPPVELSATASSVTIPAGVLESDTTYEGELSFYSISDVGQNAVEGFNEFAASLKTTRFPLGGTGPSGETSLEFGGIEVLENGDVKVTISGTLASNQLIGKLQSSTDLEAWSDVETFAKSALDGNGGGIEVVHSGGAGGSAKFRFYRVIVE